MYRLITFASFFCMFLTSGCEDTSHLGDYGGSVDIVNSTGHTLWEIFVSHENSSEWEENVLNNDEVLADGESFTVYLKGYASPIFDIQAVDQDDDSYTYYGVDISEYNVEFTIEDIDK